MTHVEAQSGRDRLEGDFTAATAADAQLRRIIAFHPDDLDPLMERWRALLSSGEAGELEARLRRHDGVSRLPLYTNRVASDYTGVVLDDVGAESYRMRVFHPEDVERLCEDRQAALARPVPSGNEQRRVAVEQASTSGWSTYVGPLGEVIGMKKSGASAPLKAQQTKFGFTPERVVAAARETLARARARR